MNRIDKLFSEKKGDILNVYFTAGYPAIDSTSILVKALESSGVDIIEIGMPYSDPLADGPTIQHSSQLALKNGMTLTLLFDQIEEIRKTTEIPLIMMGYFNQVMQYGEEAFIKKCVEVGVDGLILPDLPLQEYEESYQHLFKKYNLGISFLMTPQTSHERVVKIDSLSRGFIYMVSSASITGAKSGISEAQINYFERTNLLKLKNPRLIGFGISDQETFNTACVYSNGAIIGSAFIKAIGKEGDLATLASNFVNGILK
jgi:tryptophan synthase alpha chain